MTAAVAVAVSSLGTATLPAPPVTGAVVSSVAAGAQPIDTVFIDFRDLDGLRAEAAAAARDGFTGKLAIHPDQVEIINAAFTPSRREIDRARDIVAMFAASPEAGVISLNGQMYDRPHLTRAERVLARAGLAGKS